MRARWTKRTQESNIRRPTKSGSSAIDTLGSSWFDEKDDPNFNKVQAFVRNAQRGRSKTFQFFVFFVAIVFVPFVYPCFRSNSRMNDTSASTPSSGNAL